MFAVTPLCAAAARGHAGCVAALLREGGARCGGPAVLARASFQALRAGARGAGDSGMSGASYVTRVRLSAGRWSPLAACLGAHRLCIMLCAVGPWRHCRALLADGGSVGCIVLCTMFARLFVKRLI